MTPLRRSFKLCVVFVTSAIFGAGIALIIELQSSTETRTAVALAILALVVGALQVQLMLRQTKVLDLQFAILGHKENMTASFVDKAADPTNKLELSAGEKRVTIPLRVAIRNNGNRVATNFWLSLFLRVQDGRYALIDDPNWISQKTNFRGKHWTTMQYDRHFNVPIYGGGQAMVVEVALSLIPSRGPYPFGYLIATENDISPTPDRFAYMTLEFKEPVAQTLP